MAEHEFRVTVEDLTTGDRKVMEFAAGDYVLIPFGAAALVCRCIRWRAGT